jgi:hypothetical protein
MTDTIAELRALLAKATGGPYDHMEGMGIVRALRGDVAIPLFETRTPWHDPQHGAPTVRLAGEVVFRANSEGAKTSEALGREWNNAALVTAALNALPALLDRVEAGEWRPIETFEGQPTGQANSVLVAVTGGDRPSVVGEAYFDPRAYGGTWWWAGTDSADYHASPIDEIMHGTVTHWRPLPDAPALQQKADAP